MPELPPEFGKRELPENKHYGFIKSPFPPSPYLELSEAQKEAIIKVAKRNLNFVTIFDQDFDLARGIFPSAEVTYILKAPQAPGTYSLTAAFLYGTENASTAGFFQRPSGRILFSEEIRVVVE